MPESSSSSSDKLPSFVVCAPHWYTVSKDADVIRKKALKRVVGAGGGDGCRRWLEWAACGKKGGGIEE